MSQPVVFILKQCHRCGAGKSLDDFPAFTSGGMRRRRSWCTACIATVDEARNPLVRRAAPRHRPGAARTCPDCNKAKTEFPTYFDRRACVKRTRTCCADCYRARETARRRARGIPPRKRYVPTTKPARPGTPPLPTADELAAWHRNGCRLSSRSAAA